VDDVTAAELVSEVGAAMRVRPAPVRAGKTRGTRTRTTKTQRRVLTNPPSMSVWTESKAPHNSSESPPLDKELRHNSGRSAACQLGELSQVFLGQIVYCLSRRPLGRSPERFAASVDGVGQRQAPSRCSEACHLCRRYARNRSCPLDGHRTPRPGAGD